ncbi:MAG: eukaryotic-like serine/threonine-protein kinase [Verrucomicrobiota bacterium]|jgi:formylglycine-generating enzyme required for sulfatase activity
MIKCDVDFPIPLPDDPRKWDGWNKYKSSNFYERLCLDPQANPSNDLIEEHCRELMRWWQKKLPLKNQPSNPIAQLLRSGLEESSRYLTEARVELLDPKRRQQMDGELAAHAHEEAIVELHKYIAFALADGTLSAEEEKRLQSFGAAQGLSPEEITSHIEAELKDTGAKRAVLSHPTENGATRRRRERSLDPKEDFLRILRLSGLDSDAMTDDQRDAFINVAENLGIDAGDAEELVDFYLEEAERLADPDAAPQEAPTFTKAAKNGSAPARPFAAPAVAAVSVASPVQHPIFDAPAKIDNFRNSAGGEMLFVPAGEFIMGNETVDAPPNERPLTKITLSRFFMSRFPVTNGEYEQFDPSHARKRAPGAGERHPVVYVSSLEAIKFCQWLSARERKKFRLPTEAEWEYAARGAKDTRKFPWGDFEHRGDLANFADKNTVFAWSDREIDDGYPESSPVGAFPRGASPFGLEDMAGNVWEWCLDYYEPYRGTPKVNPRGPTSGAKRVYRGGSWKSRFNSLRTTTRGSNAPNYSCNDLGFRIVCEAE